MVSQSFFFMVHSYMAQKSLGKKNHYQFPWKPYKGNHLFVLCQNHKKILSLQIESVWRLQRSLTSRFLTTSVHVVLNSCQISWELLRIKRQGMWKCMKCKKYAEFVKHLYWGQLVTGVKKWTKNDFVRWINIREYFLWYCQINSFLELCMSNNQVWNVSFEGYFHTGGGRVINISVLSAICPQLHSVMY